jgi:hypothetical protein
MIAIARRALLDHAGAREPALRRPAGRAVRSRSARPMEAAHLWAPRDLSQP